MDLQSKNTYMKRLIIILIGVLVAITSFSQTPRTYSGYFRASANPPNDSINFATQNMFWWGLNNYWRYSENGVKKSLKTLSGSLSGSGSVDRLAYWTDASTLSFGPYWDNANGTLGIGQAAASAFIIDANKSSASGVGSRIRNLGTGDVTMRIQRDAGAVTWWDWYLPNGDTELQLFSEINHRFSFLSNGTFKLLATPTNDNTNTSILTRDGSGNVETKNDVVDGSGAANRLAYWTDSNTQSSEAALGYDPSLNLVALSNVAGTATTSVFGGEIQLDNISGGDDVTFTNAGIQASGQSDYNISNSSGTVSIQGVPYNNSSGTYTPTLTNGTNVDASTAHVTRYSRIGNEVRFSGTVEIDVTSATTSSNLFMSLPIASNFVSSDQAGGIAFCGDIFGLGCSVYADATNDRLVFVFISQPSSTGNQIFTFSGSYQIL
jgi:hypothetical protein